MLELCFHYSHLQSCHCAWVEQALLRQLLICMREQVVIYPAFCLDVAQGRMNGAPDETQTHSGRLACRAC